MTDKYTFVDRKCDRCNGKGFILHDYKNGYFYCPECHGTGMIGSYEKILDADIKKTRLIAPLARQLRKVREQRKIGMIELANMLGWDLVRLSDIETGRENPTRAECNQIEEWLELG